MCDSRGEASLVADLETTIAAVRRDGKRRDARCPAHEDQRASLSVGLGAEGRVLLKCQAGCTFAAVRDAAGLQSSDLSPQRTDGTNSRGSRIEVTYDYTDEHGKLLYQVCRKEPKAFVQRRPDGGGWSWHIGDVRRVLYRLPALSGSASVYVVEGEKDADRLASFGLVATTNAGGAGKWRDDYARQLVTAGARSVVVLPDNDTPGRNHAADVARSCTAAGLSVRVIDLPGLPPKGDVSDWFNQRHTRDELEQLVSSATVWTPAAAIPPALPFMTPAQIGALPAATEDHIGPYITRGAITEIDAYAKRGKTSFVLYQIGCLVHGVDCLGQPTKQTSCVYLTEERKTTFNAALQRAGLQGLTDRLYVLSKWDLEPSVTWPEVVAHAVTQAHATASGVLVVDTLAGWAGLTGDAENNAGDALLALEPLQRAAAQGGLAVLISRHDRKGGGAVGESARGSSAFTGAVDSIVALKRPEGNAPKNQRLLEAISRFEHPGYYPESQVIERGEDSIHSYPTGLRFEKNLYRALGPAGALELNRAKTAVLDVMAASSEPLSADHVKTAVADLNISAPTLGRALEALTEERRIERLGKGRRNSPFTYSQRAEVSSQTSIPRDRDEKNPPKEVDGAFEY